MSKDALRALEELKHRMLLSRYDCPIRFSQGDLSSARLGFELPHGIRVNSYGDGARYFQANEAKTRQGRRCVLPEVSGKERLSRRNRQ